MTQEDECDKKRNLDNGNDHDATDMNTSTTNKKPKLENNHKENTVVVESNENQPTTKADNHDVDNHLTKEDKMVRIQQELEKIIGNESATNVIQLLQKWETIKINNCANKNNRSNQFPPKGIDDETKYVTLPLIEDKQKRKDIHMVIKSDLMKDIAMADTFEKKVRIWHKVFEKQMPNYQKFGTINNNNDANNNDNRRPKRETWPKDRPNFLRFVLYKENIDTTTAIKDITRIVRIQPKGPRGCKSVSGGITYAGMKDKRGVTAQYCTVFRKTPKDLLVMNRDRKNPKGSSGGGNTKDNGSCIIRVGGFSYVDKELRLGLLQGNRFEIVLRNVCLDDDNNNTNKEDTIKKITETLRIGAKAMKDTGFINFFGMQRFGKFHDTHLVGIAVLKGDFKTACDLIMQVKPEEQERYKQLRIKWENRLNDVDMNKDNAVDEAEMECAKELLKGLGRFMNCETSIMHSLSRKPRDYKKAFSCIVKHMRSMFLHAYQSYLWNKAASYRIEKGGASEVMEGDLVLIDRKKLGAGDNSTSGLKGKRVTTVSQDDVETGKYKITDVVLPLIGTRTELPTNSTGDYMEDLLKEDELTLESFARIQDRDLALGGDYRKIICKPTDLDFEIKLYKDSVHPLIKTDLMAIHGEELDCVDVTSDIAKVKGEEMDNKTLVAMVIGFTLPSSAYATIALRELMKRPTSTEYQTSLNLEGDCENVTTSEK